MKQEKIKPHNFCETPEEKCTMNYCDDNGCMNRKRELVEPKIETLEEANEIILENLLEENYDLNVQFHKSMRESIFCFAVVNYDEKLPFKEWEKKHYGNYIEQPKHQQEIMYSEEDMKEAFNGFKSGKSFMEWFEQFKTNKNYETRNT